MDITQKRQIPQDIYTYIKLIKLDKYPINLLGSAGIASQQYYSDYDLISMIREKNCEKLYHKLSHIIDMTENNPNMYLIEIKIQTKTGRKIRELPSLSKFCSIKNIEFIKLDYIIRLQNRFVELSIIYSLSPSEEEFKISVKKDIDELYKKKQYYKVLKRIFSLLSKQQRSKERDEKLILLTKFFNSPVGKVYQDASNLKAIKLLLEHYTDTDTRNKANLNLKDLHLKLSDISKLEKAYNQEAKKILDLI